MNFQEVSGELNSAPGNGEKASIKIKRETRTDDLELLPLPERKRKLIYPDVPSKGLNVKEVTPSFSKEWPGLPKGVKFDPSDEELLWHLLAETGKGVAKRHPFINEFIVSLDEDDGLGNVHPQFLPGVKQDGSMSYFFHRKAELYSSRKLKRKENYVNSVEICWHSIDKLNLLCVDGILQGSKEILTLYMIPVNGGNPVKTPWSIHQYHISINGAEDNLVVSKIFYDMLSKQDIQDSRIDSVDGFVTEMVGVAAPLQVAPDFHERLRVESVSVDASTQVSAMLAPAELTIDKLSQKVVDHSLGGEANVEHVGYLEKARINFDKHSEGSLATDQLPRLEAFYEAAAEINIFSTSAKSEISIIDRKDCAEEKRTVGFQGKFGDSQIGINNSNHDKVIGDDTCDSNDTHFSMEMSCPDRAPENVLQEHVSGEINTTGIFSGHVSMEKHEAYSQCIDEAHVPLSRISSSEHNIAHGNPIDKLFILGLPAYSLKGKPSKATKSKIATEKNSNNLVNISIQSALPVKIEPKSFEDTAVGIAHEKSSNNRLNASGSSGLINKVKTEPSEEAEEKIFPHFHSEEGIPICNLSHEAYTPEDLYIRSAEILSTKISGLDELILETNGLINQHPKRDGNAYDGLLMICENSQVIGDNKFYSQINVHATEPQSDSVSSSSFLNVKSEPVERSFLNYLQIPPCNTRGHSSLMFENKRELSSDSPLDRLDHVPLKYRPGISVSDGDGTVKSGYISEKISPVTPGFRSCGSVKTKECLSFSRRKKKKTATDSVEKAMEEDAPGLLRVLLDRGIQVEEIKLYGDLEDNDLLETSCPEGSFGELEAVMTKLFSERSSLLRFTGERPVKGSRAFYCLDGLISLIEQTRYLCFRQTPVDWGWCRDLKSFIFVFLTHNRIVLERPEYGYATYFFELVDTLPVDWQVKRLVMAMKLPNCSRTILIENKTLIVGEDLSEGEARVLEAYGWTRNTGFGTLLNYCDRVVHDRRNVMYGSEWRAKIGKMLMNGYDGGRMVLTVIPEKVVEYLGSQNSEIKMEL